MRRTRLQSDDQPGQDSFLDIVSNMVGILIILVMVVGARASQAPVDLPDPSNDDVQDQLAGRKSESFSLETDVLRLHEQSQQVQQEIAASRQERELLATVILAAKDELHKRQQQLDTKAQAQYAVAREQAALQAELERVRQTQQTLAARPRQLTKIQNLPTPISKTVHGAELHFQLRGGRLTKIPLQALLDEFRSEARNKVWKLKNQTEVTEVVGPIEGFRLRYRLRRFDVSAEEQFETGAAGSVVRLTRWELLPVSATLGEPIDEVLSPGSRLFDELKRANPGRTTVTVWTYPDSFAAFRRLKAELHALGLATAARPLPEGEPIAGSPEGTRSAAQ